MIINLLSQQLLDDAYVVVLLLFADTGTRAKGQNFRALMFPDNTLAA